MKLPLRPVWVLFAALTVLTGLVYPLVVTGIGKLFFPQQVAGSLLMRDGKAVGSSLISQSFSDPKYFWGRLSATAPMPNNAGASGGSNFGPTNPAAPQGVETPEGVTYYTSSPVAVTLGGTPVSVDGAALAPGFAGLFQVAIQIPESMPNGDYALVATVSGARSPATVLLTVSER